MNAFLSSVQSQIMIRPGTMAEAGQAANHAAESLVFKLYQDRRPINTQRAQRAALAIFASFMRTCGIMPTGDLYSDPTAWQGVTWGIVQAFQAWQLQTGYAIKTINDRVSMVKVYMTMANAAGMVSDGEILRLHSLKAYSHKEAIDTDQKRAADGIATRKGHKKISATQITEEQARALCTVRNDTPQARRDVLIFCLMTDHAMRVSEVSDLRVENIDRAKKQAIFYRRKTGTTSKHNLRGRCWQLLQEYLAADNTAQNGPLILASCKTGALVQKGMSTSALADRVREIGRSVGIANLSPHDLRHAAATFAGIDPNVSLAGLMSFGGWKSANIAAGYMNRGEADNDGVFLGMDAISD